MRAKCPYCPTRSPGPDEVRTVRGYGKYWRKSDGQWISRFWCLTCQKHFSSATSHPCYRQNKRHKNNFVKKLFAAHVSQREMARVLRLNRKTVVRKLLFLAERAELEMNELNLQQGQALEVEFDDLETFEHTKCKPLSITLMVESKTRRILGFEVSKMPAKGPLAAISRKKYGPRIDERPLGRKRLFEKTQNLIHPLALIRSDSNPHYPEDVKKFFPKATHQQIKGARGAITGQGELKKVKFDPIFSLNHTCAMFRANVNRLIRKTWCTTKKPERLRAHLFLYAHSHNQRLLQKKSLGK